MGEKDAFSGDREKTPTFRGIGQNPGEAGRVRLLQSLNSTFQ
jgi:hypothetical protein